VRRRCLYVWRHAGPQQRDRRHTASAAIIRCKVSDTGLFRFYSASLGVSIACYAERCISYDRFRLSDRLTVRHMLVYHVKRL